jgi:hypothetical protein
MVEMALDAIELGRNVVADCGRYLQMMTGNRQIHTASLLRWVESGTVVRFHFDGRFNAQVHCGTKACHIQVMKLLQEWDSG